MPTEEEEVKKLIDCSRLVEGQTACLRDAVLHFRSTPGNAAINYEVLAEIVELLTKVSEGLDTRIPAVVEF